MSIDPIASRLAADGVAFAPEIAERRPPVRPRSRSARRRRRPRDRRPGQQRRPQRRRRRRPRPRPLSDRRPLARLRLDPGRDGSGAKRRLCRRHALRACSSATAATSSEALSAYNTGSPTATGTKTRWADGSDLAYADSVMRHYQRLTGASAQSSAIAESSTTIASVGALHTRSAPPPCRRLCRRRRWPANRMLRARTTAKQRTISQLLSDDTDENNS